MSNKRFTSAPETPKKMSRGFGFPSPKPSFAKKLIEDEEQSPPGCKSLECDETLDVEELEATQVIPGPDDSQSSDDEDPEVEFRAHCREVMTEHGVENARAWFSIEARKFKKPRLEKNK